MIFIEPEINIGEISSVVTWLRKAMLSTTIYSLVLLIIFFTNKDFRNITTEFLKRIKSKLFSKTSYFDFKQEEANYHMFVLGMLIQMKKHYKIKSNLEAGRGIRRKIYRSIKTNRWKKLLSNNARRRDKKLLQNRNKFLQKTSKSCVWSCVKINIRKIKKYIDFYNKKSYYVLIEIKKYEI